MSHEENHGRVIPHSPQSADQDPTGVDAEDVRPGASMPKVRSSGMRFLLLVIGGNVVEHRVVQDGV